MAYELMILNPRPKRATRSKSKGAPKVAKKRRIKRGRGGRFVKASAAPVRRRRRTSARKRVTNPRRKKSTAKRIPFMAYKQGPGKVRRRKVNPRRRHHAARRRHHNPRFSMNGVLGQLTPAAIGAAGAIANDVLLGYASTYLPATLQTGYGKRAVQIASALGLGFVGQKFLRGKGAAAGAGALTVALYGLFKDVLVQYAPSVKGLGDYEEIAIDNTADQIGAYMAGPGSTIGAYLPDGSQLKAGPVGAYMAGPVDDYYDRDGSVLQGMDY